MTDLLASFYPWIKALHIMSVIAWMAGLFYLPRLFVYHAEKAKVGGELDETFQVMEYKLLRVIMNPAMIATWIFGLMLVFTPGVVAVLVMTWFHHWLALRRKDFKAGENALSGRQYRMMNELPTILMAVIVLSVVVRF